MGLRPARKTNACSFAFSFPSFAFSVRSEGEGGKEWSGGRNSLFGGNVGLAC